jgi:hypothetical protein
VENEENVEYLQTTFSVHIVLVEKVVCRLILLALAMEELANNINSFVRLFSSINYLFCHVRWLERNIRNSSLSVLLIVGGIIFFALYFMTDGNSSFLETLGFPAGSSLFFKTYGPLCIVLLLIALFLFKRFDSGSQGGNIDTVLFGDSPAHPEDERVDTQHAPKLYHGTPVSPSNSFSRRSMV